MRDILYLVGLTPQFSWFVLNSVPYVDQLFKICDIFSLPSVGQLLVDCDIFSLPTYSVGQAVDDSPLLLQ